MAAKASQAWTVTTDTGLFAEVVQLTYAIGEGVESLFPTKAIDSDFAPAGNEKASSVLDVPGHFLARLQKTNC